MKKHICKLCEDKLTCSNKEKMGDEIKRHLNNCRTAIRRGMDYGDYLHE